MCLCVNAVVEDFVSMLKAGRCGEEGYYHSVKRETVIGHFPIDPHYSCINWGIRLSSRRVKTYTAGNAPREALKALQ